MLKIVTSGRGGGKMSTMVQNVVDKLNRKERQIDWLVDELAYALIVNETQAACPADPEAIERKRLAIITDMQEIE